MPPLPAKIFLTRQDVITAVRGRRQLEQLEAAGKLERVYPAGYKRARYVRADVKRVLDDLGCQFR
jgi:hypothetical protein